MSRTAVVIGAGAAGILAAAALALVVDQVVVLERDALPDGPENRKGVPQGRHAHLMMAGGLDAMDTLIPGMDMRKHLIASGANEISLCRDMVVFSSVGWFHRWRHADPLIVTCSRALLDWAIRTAVLKSLNNIEIRQAKAIDLLGDSERVRGVRIATAGPDTPFDADFTAKYGLQLSADRGEADLYADFVVDASGRGSRISTWLGSIGVNDIPERTLDSGLVNSTRLYRIPEGAGSWPLTMIQPNPFTGGPARSGMIVPIEGNRWMVSLGGSRGGEPPKDPDAFLQYALDLPHPIVGQLIAGAEPLTQVFTSHSTSNTRRYLEKAAVWPENLVVLGDALATFNPLYGQGMSVAALGAQALAKTIWHRWGSQGLARRVQREVAKSVDAAWTLAVSSDVLYPNVIGGEPTATDRLAAQYTRRLTRSATGSYSAASALFDVTSMRKSALRLMQPRPLLAALTGPALPSLSGPPLTPAEQETLRGLIRAGQMGQGPQPSA
ncbi:NAD(P)/FAD-dependent oxidoreductase [Streptomyces monashensis]|uniref:Pyridine nucleotide-disulfide oxidoreductase n=1 Tax=Streptomyces monashensis TaxID=1678012 RepID=A0A1S2PIM6_9ACTN|nr:FAD-dependent monooxygenase [Streptomyces monashensis]OIJ93597.1 pyridine nucleotide-disulfide oxidoreductase [Streptomyces monashensis]